jgi:hypothetical protein
MWLASEAVKRPNGLLVLIALVAVHGCDQLGNPPQYTTGPSPWEDARGHLVTSTRSFRNESTIRRLASEDLSELDHVDPSVGPSQTLTMVSVVPRRLRASPGPTIVLVTIFELEGQAPVVRRWSVSASERRWNGAFALPTPPKAAVTSVAP